jgi:hypothetical protein
MKKLLVTVFSSVLMLTGLTAHAATKIELTGPDIGVRITENQEMLTDGPFLMAQTQTKDGERFYLCKALDDEICKNASNIKAVSYLPPCDAINGINCISSVYAVSEQGVKTEGIFQRYVAEGASHEYASETRFNLPQGKGQGSIWTFSGLKNAAGNEDYYVGARFDSWAPVNGGVISQNFYPGRLIGGISPVSIKSGAFGETFPLDSNNPSSDGSPNGGVGSRNTSSDQSWKDCVVTEIGKCYMAEDFPSGHRFGMTLKLGATIRGWFHGRIYQPVITTKSGSNAGAQEITIEALPVIVPTLQEKVSTAAVTTELRDFLRNNEVSNGFGYVMPESSGSKSFEHTKLWIPVIKDKATTSKTYWSVRTLDQINDPIISSCTKSDGALSGVVTTNSLVYNAGPPDFDKESQNLDYKVLSTHYSADGTVAKGTYDLILSSTVARCIYGFTSAPIQASLTILSDDGVAQVATQVINEKNGWLTLSAAGFSYSSPTIKVKLSQEVAKPAPTSSTPASTTVPKRKVTINCVKGKVIKKITASSPKCPTGYKKKG